ncbi:hypothetical protein A3860_21215 [Niastella vici]|uniref:Iron dicitrate transport regulator FecR n=1 Tax=Niastella vici TaxID=1703345 RepID=A0A1V9G042_9BACT|nr:FecR family protein [Niastella vici]OQP63947.1 hypothetical protein A3860_21215 [Niastella vici]
MSLSNPIADLYQRYLADQCTAAEIKQLLAYFDAGENEPLLKELVLQTLEADNTILETSDAFTESVLVNIKTAIREKSIPIAKRTIPMYQRNWFRVAAIACLVLLATITGFLLTGRMKTAASAAVLPEIAKTEILPGKDAAKLILADGSVIVLDSAGNGALAKQGAAAITKKNGEISYGQMTASRETIFNSLATDRGNQYQLRLADGSKVWLNAASSIRFPTTFTGSERRVEVSGEVYFEVAHDAAKPFIVKISLPGGADGGEVKVLGTHFNVNAYKEEGAIKTTLLEGSVQFTRKNKKQVLQPGQQAIADNTKNNIGIAAANIEKEMAWKNGLFLFDTDHIENIMRQISRWYDIDVVYEGDVSRETFSGVLSRSSNINQVLKILEAGGLQYKLEGKKIIVTK